MASRLATCYSAPAKSRLIRRPAIWLPATSKFQTERVLQNVKAILDDQKLTFANAVKSTVFLTDLADFAGMNEIYAKYFTGDFPHVRRSRSPRCPKAANVEIEVVAHF